MVSKVATVQAGGPKFNPRNARLRKSLCRDAIPITPACGRRRQVDPWDSPASQPSFLGKFQVSVSDPASKDKMEDA